MITVSAFIDFKELKCRLIAGERGLSRRIEWAHVSELEDPTPWLAGGELIMTTGIGIPKGATRQLAYIRRFVHKKVAGLAIGDNMNAPPLAPAMLNLANKHGFPLVLVAREIPFIALAKRVAAANRDAIHERLAAHLRVYETLHDLAHSEADPAQLLDRLGKIAHCNLYLLTSAGQPLFPGLPTPPHPLPAGPDHLWEYFEQSGPTPLAWDEEGGQRGFLLPVYAKRLRLGVLAAFSNHRSDVDQLILHHIATIASLAAVELLHDRERERRNGSERLLRFLAEPGQFAQGAASLFPGVTAPDPVTFAAIRLTDTAEGWDSVHHALIDGGFTVALARKGSIAYVLVVTRPGRDAQLERVFATALPNARIGLSRALPLDANAEIGLQEAASALRSALLQGKIVHRFDPRDISEWLPLEYGTMRLSINRTLGTILEYDEQHRTTLYPTLKTFLETDQKSKLTATRLQIHRQTLVYRLKRIEELTGRSLRSTGDVCDLWLAVKARDALLAAEEVVPLHIAGGVSGQLELRAPR